MIVSKRSGFFRRQNLMMIRFIYLFIYFYYFFFNFTFFCPCAYPKNAVYSLHIKNRSLTYRFCGKEQDKHGKKLHSSLSCNCKIEIPFAGHVLKAQIC